MGAFWRCKIFHVYSTSFPFHIKKSAKRFACIAKSTFFSPHLLLPMISQIKSQDPILTYFNFVKVWLK
ncbi:hypothetical protein CsatA_028357 [Cannabis sativa]